jgi:CheY-like chemotaxis protein
MKEECENHNKTVLFVDDDEIILKLGVMFIDRFGCNTIKASSGEEAISLLCNKEDEIDMIFLDLMMPVKSGFDVLAFMTDKSIKIPTIVQTGMVSESDLRKALRMGAMECLCKPYSKEKIHELLDRYL